MSKNIGTVIQVMGPVLDIRCPDDQLPELLSGELCLSENPTVKERETYAIPDRHAITLVADSEGTATCNFTREGLADGLYLAVGKEENFYLCLPRVDATGELIGSILRIPLD